MRLLTAVARHERESAACCNHLRERAHGRSRILLQVSLVEPIAHHHHGFFKLRCIVQVDNFSAIPYYNANASWVCQHINFMTTSDPLHNTRRAWVYVNRTERYDIWILCQNRVEDFWQVLNRLNVIRCESNFLEHIGVVYEV